MKYPNKQAPAGKLRDETPLPELDAFAAWRKPENLADLVVWRTFAARMKIKSTHIKDASLIVAGAFIQAFAYAAFCLPYKIVPGGVYGTTIAINHLSKGLFGLEAGLPIGVTALFFNIPLFILAWRKLGLSSGGKTIATFLLISIFSDVITRLLGDFRFIQDDTILAGFYGGAILGLGVFMIFKAGSTSAGTDVLARILTKGTNLKLSTMIIVIDSSVVLFGLFAFRDWSVPLYSWLTIFIYGQVVGLLQPQNPHKAVFIVSQKQQAVRTVIVEHLGMRGTFLHGCGMYAAQEREVIFMIIERKDIFRLKKAVMAVDPQAFISTSNASNDTHPKLV